MRRPLRIGVIGSGSCGPEAADAARSLGAVLAREGAAVLCGGLGGVMAAAADGAASEGGTVIGLLPGSDPSAAAGGVSLPIATGLGHSRNAVLVRASEAVVAVAGEWGTRSEASLCIKMRVPLVGLRDTLGEVFAIERFRDPVPAATRALELARAGRGGPEAPATRERAIP